MSDVIKLKKKMNMNIVTLSNFSSIWTLLHYCYYYYCSYSGLFYV